MNKLCIITTLLSLAVFEYVELHDDGIYTLHEDKE